MEKIKLLIVDDVPQTRKDMARLLYFEDDLAVIGEAGDGADALQKIAELGPDVVLMDVNMPGMDGITATERANQLFPAVAVVMISIQGEAEYLKKAMVAGARDYLVKPLDSEQMSATIRSVFSQQRRRLEAKAADGSAVSPPSPAQEEEKASGVVSVIFGGKGGTGKTTLAVNLAVTLAEKGRKRVVLVDLDLQFGDVGVMLNLTEGKTISDLVREQSDITASALESYLLRHFSGIDILPAPLFPQEAEYISAEQTARLLKLLRARYDYVIVDTAANFNEINLQVLELADQILLLLTKDLAAIKNTRTSLSILDLLDLREKVRFVLNRSDQSFGVEIPDLEKGLGITVSHLLPCDERAITAAINKGVPVVISSPAAEISRSCRRLGERMATGRRLPAVEREGKNLINRIFSL